MTSFLRSEFPYRQLGADVGLLGCGSLGFVALLYVWKGSRGHWHALRSLHEAATDMRYEYIRNDPHNIRRRVVSVSATAALASAYMISTMGISKFISTYFVSDTLIRDVCSSVGITSVLFAGVLATKFFFPADRVCVVDVEDSSDSDGEEPCSAALAQSRSRWMHLRNLLFAPLAEEVVFRAFALFVIDQSSIAYPGWARYGMVALCFSSAHVHHCMSHAIVAYRAQGAMASEADREAATQRAWAHARRVVRSHVIITTLFSLLNTLLFVEFANSNVVAATLAHSLCNLLGPPSLFYLQDMDRFAGRRADEHQTYEESGTYPVPPASTWDRVCRYCDYYCTFRPGAALPSTKRRLISAAYIAGIVGFFAISASKLRVKK